MMQSTICNHCKYLQSTALSFTLSSLLHNQWCSSCCNHNTYAY